MGDSKVSKVIGGIRLVVRQGRRYSKIFGNARGWSLAVRDRPGSSGTTMIRWNGYPELELRLGGTDVRTFCHVICDQGYQSPFEYSVRPPKWIVDGGANIGLAAAYFAARYPDATVIAIEPDGDNFEVLSRNAALFSNVIPVQAAIWSHDGTVDLADPGSGSWGYRVSDGREDDVFSHSVNATTVPSLMTQYDIDFIDILKIDIEGGEREIFEGRPKWISSVGSIAIELHDRTTPGCTAAFESATTAFSRREVVGEDTFVAL